MTHLPVLEIKNTNPYPGLSVKWQEKEWVYSAFYLYGKWVETGGDNLRLLVTVHFRTISKRSFWESFAL